LNDAPILPLGIICNILYTGWSQNGVWLGRAISLFAQYKILEENKNENNKK
jgi:hypothetical protein